MYNAADFEYDEEDLEALSAMNYELQYLESINCIPDAQEYSEILDPEDPDSVAYTGEYLEVDYDYDVPEKPKYYATANIEDIYTQICSEWGFDDRYTLTLYYLAAAREKKKRFDLIAQAQELKKKLDENYSPSPKEIAVMTSSDIHQQVQQMADLEKAYLLELKKRKELTKEERQRLPSYLR